MILKIYNEATTVRGVANENREREFIISNERRDMHGTIIRLAGWEIEDYNRGGAFYYQHLTGNEAMPNPDNVLGPGQAWKEDKTLVGKAFFEPADINPLAEKIMRKVDYGTLTSTSVGFMPLEGHWGTERKDEDPETYYFDKQILKEFSIVNIPSNPDAVKKSYEAYDWFMGKRAEEHVSEGFKKDYKYNLRKIRNQREHLLNLAGMRNLL